MSTTTFRLRPDCWVKLMRGGLLAGGVEVVGLGRAGAAALGALVAVAVEGLLV